MMHAVIEQKLDRVAQETGWDRDKVKKALEIISNEINNNDDLDFHSIIRSLMKVSIYTDEFKEYCEYNLLNTEEQSSKSILCDFVAANHVRHLDFSIRGFFPINPEILGSIERLNRNRVYTIGDLVQYSKSELRGKFNIALSSIEKMELEISRYGLRFGMRISDAIYKRHTPEILERYSLYEKIYHRKRLKKLQNGV